MSLKDIQRKAKEKNKAFGLDFTFKKGKWEGFSIREVIDSDPGYMKYLVYELGFELDNEAYGELEYVLTNDLPF